MWRFPLRVALVLLLGLTGVLLSLMSYPIQAVTAGPPEGATTPAVASSRLLTVRVVAVTSCPGDWTVANLQPSNATPFTLRIVDTTRFMGVQCGDIQVNDTLRVQGDVPADLPSLMTARFVWRLVTPPTPATTQTITFRGTIIGNPRPVSTGYEVQFNTEVSGALTVTVPSALLGGVTPRRGDKADVTAQREGNTWTATSLKFLSATSDIGFSGLIEFAPNGPPYQGTWKIAGRQVVVNSATTIVGIPKQYRRATVIAEQQGNGLRAKMISIEAVDAPATAFELAGTAYITDQSPFTTASVLGCLTFTLDPATSLPPTISRWNDLTLKSVQITGSRNLGVSSSFKADHVSLLEKPYTDPTSVEIMGYVDDRQVVPATGDVNLQIGHILIRVSGSLANQDRAVRGTVVRIRGNCISQLEKDLVQASGIDVISQTYVPFNGTIEVIEMDGAEISGIQLRPPGSNDLLHILRQSSVPFVGGNDPVVGGCLSGYGYYQRDGSIMALRLEVVGCAPTRPDTAEEGGIGAPSD